MSSFFKFLAKPSYLLLENQGSETSSENDDQAFCIQLFLERSWLYEFGLTIIMSVHQPLFIVYWLF